MLSSSNPAQIQRLRPGDRIQYRGIEWRVIDYSTYNDPYGYETQEWLLKSGKSKQYYLLREIDPQNPNSLLNWYLAEEIKSAKIYLPEYGQNIVGSLWRVIHDKETPYPELQMFGKSYYFESQTEGTYEEGNEETYRITWDYWDKPHQWNLALEAWPNGELHVYATQVVNIGEFFKSSKTLGNLPWLKLLRILLGLGGIILLMVGLTMLIYG